MANFTPRMLSDLLNSPDPKDQELARQLSDLEFSNENGRLVNYPAPQQPDVSQSANAPSENNFTFTPEGMSGSLAHIQSLPGSKSIADAFTRAKAEIALGNSPTKPQQQEQQAASPDMGSGDNFVPMTSGSQPVPLGLNAFEQAAWRRANYGAGDSFSPPGASQAPAVQPFAQTVAASNPNQFRNEQTGAITTLSPPQQVTSDRVKVLDQMRQKDGSIFQLVERETPRGIVKETRVVMPDAMNPYKLAETKAAQAQATLEKTSAEAAKARMTPEQMANSEFLKEKAKLKAQNAMFEGMGATTGTSGQDLLANVPVGIATQVKKLASGEMAFPGGFAMRSPYWQNMLTMVAQYDPTFDATNYNKRNQTAAAFSKGQQGNAVRAVNQTLSHMENLSNNIGALDNFNGLATPLNSIVNPVESIFGDPRQGNFKQTVQAVASELRRVFSTGGVGNLMELKQWEETLPVNASKEQQTSYLQNGVSLLKGALSALDGQYKAGMGLNASVTDLLSPKAKAALAKLGGVESPQSNTTTKQPTSQLAIPDSAVVYLRKNPALAAQFDVKYGAGASAQILGGR